MKQTLLSGLSRLERLFVAPFSTEVDADLLRKIIELCRVAFGLLLVERYVSIAGYSVLSDTPSQVLTHASAAACLSGMIAVGFLTPLALAALVAFFLVFPPFASTLGDQVAIILSWGLLFLGAGKRYSVDAMLATKLRRIFSFLYGLSRPLTAMHFARVRAFQIFLFWGLGYSAMSFHFKDETWLNLRALHLFLTLPYMSVFAEQFEKIHQAAPVFFDACCRLGLVLQGAWELLLFPLALTRLGMMFATVQGLFFFLFSAFGIHLGYLPYYELVWWLLFFGAPLLARFHIVEAQVPTGSREVAARFPLSEIIMGSGVVVTAVFLVNLTVLEFLPASPLARLVAPLRFSALSRVFGQYPIDVFNRADLEMGNDNFVLLETGANGEPVRLVPVLDKDGGRLDLLRNDFAYFDHSLRWQRSAVSACFDDPAGTRPSEYTLQLVRKFVKLDRCLSRDSRPSRYELLFFRRAIEHGPKFPMWTKSQFVSRHKLVVDTSSEYWSCEGAAFKLPIGHIGSSERGEETYLELVEFLDAQTVKNKAAWTLSKSF